MSGANEFPLKLTAKDIQAITESAKQFRIEDIKFIRSATLEEIQAAYILMSLAQFMQIRHVPPGFEVVLSE